MGEEEKTAAGPEDLQKKDVNERVHVFTGTAIEHRDLLRDSQLNVTALSPEKTCHFPFKINFKTKSGPMGVTMCLFHIRFSF